MSIQDALSQASSQDPIIKVEKLAKKFDGVTAVDEISFSVQRGELFGFLGPNGAGKTTTINMLTGLARPDSGRIQIAGFDCEKNPKKAQRLIGVVPDESNLYPELTGFDNLCFCAALYGLKKGEREQRARDLLRTFHLEEAANRKFGGYSKGMKRKLTIAAGIIHHPQILFLDEPTSGIDVASARQIRQLILELHHTGTTIFLTTHYIEEAERLCERIAFIVKGQIVRIDGVPDLLQPVQGKNILLVSVTGSARDLSRKLAARFRDYSFQAVSAEQIWVEAKEPISLGALVRFVEEQGAEVLEANRQRPSLEEIFVQITGIELDAMRKEKEKVGTSL